MNDMNQSQQTFQSGQEYQPVINHSDVISQKSKGNGFFSEDKMGKNNGLTAMVSTKDWLKFMCLGFVSFIPVIGFLVYLVIYVVLLLNGSTSVSIKNYIKAELIFTAIILGITFILCLILIPLIVGAGISAFNVATVSEAFNFGTSM